MKVYVNDEFVDDANAKISVFDRGLMYGDGCFETLRIYKKTPAFWAEHLVRLARSLKILSIPFSLKAIPLSQITSDLIRENDLDKGVLRIQITRGEGGRGYSPKGSHSPNIIISTHPLPKIISSNPSWKLKTSSMKISFVNPFLALKSSNRLLQIMAKAEAETKGVDDVLMLNSEGIVSETSSANLFWLEKGSILTPPLDTGALDGITRKIVLDICQEKNIPFHERRITRTELLQRKVLFLTQSLWEIIEVSQLDDHSFERSNIITQLRSSYRKRAIESPFPYI